MAPATRMALRVPGSRPYPGLPAGTDTIPGIQHIIVLMMENHSFDNLLGMLGRGDGFTLGANGLPSCPPGRARRPAAHVSFPAAAGRARRYRRGAGLLGDRPGHDPAAGLHHRVSTRTDRLSSVLR